MMKVTTVSYLNSLPFVYVLEKFGADLELSLQLATPFQCASMLLKGLTDVALVPVAALHDIPGCRILDGYCLGADGPVNSVFLLADNPVEELDVVYLDGESRTSVQLAQLLAREYWHAFPEWKLLSPGQEVYNSSSGMVLIGDKAMAVSHRYRYRYDLSEEWKKHTGLPFIFAVWATTRELTAEQFLRFSGMLEYGISHLDEVIRHYQLDDLKAQYLRKSIRYRLDLPGMFPALRLFFEKSGWVLPEVMSIQA